MSLEYKIIYLYFKIGLNLNEIVMILLDELRLNKGRRPYYIVMEILAEEIKTIEYLEKTKNLPLR